MYLLQSRRAFAETVAVGNVTTFDGTLTERLKLTHRTFCGEKGLFILSLSQFLKELETHGIFFDGFLDVGS